MTWLQPVAWFGLLALALPVLIHLLARGEARRIRLPTLRFVDRSPLLPSHRTRLDDLLLLVVRMVIIMAAVAALAQPLWVTAARRTVQDGALARAIVIDTSSSVGVESIARAGETADQLAGDADVAIVIRSLALGPAIEDAAQWLAGQSGRAELVVLSDFRGGAVDSTLLAAVPEAVGLRLIRLEGVSRDTVVRGSIADGRVVRIEAIVDSLTTRARWTVAAAGADGEPLLTAVGQEAVLARNAVYAVGAPSRTDSSRRVVVVHGAATETEGLRARAKPLAAGWMMALVSALRAEGDALHDAVEEGDTLALDGRVFAPVWRQPSGAAVVSAAMLPEAISDRLLMVVAGGADPAVSATLIAKLLQRVDATESLAEAEPLRWSEAALARWQREPSPSRTVAVRGAAGHGASDARWLWLLALLLLAVEGWLRRSRRSEAA